MDITLENVATIISSVESLTLPHSSPMHLEPTPIKLPIAPPTIKYTDRTIQSISPKESQDAETALLTEKKKQTDSSHLPNTTNNHEQPSFLPSPLTKPNDLLHIATTTPKLPTRILDRSRANGLCDLI